MYSGCVWCCAYTQYIRICTSQAAKDKWERRAPISARTLRDDARGLVHRRSAETKMLGGGLLRLTGPTAGPAAPAAAPMEKPGLAAGSGSGYYYAAVTAEARQLPVAAPPRIDASQVCRSCRSTSSSADTNTTPVPSRPLSLHLCRCSRAGRTP